MQHVMVISNGKKEEEVFTNDPQEIQNLVDAYDGTEGYEVFVQAFTAKSQTPEDVSTAAGGVGVEVSLPAYAEFNLTTGGATALSNTAQTLVLNNERINNDTDVFTLTANQVTIDKTGTYKISFDAYINNSSTARTEYSFWAEIDNTEVPQTRSAIYQRGYDSGGSSSINCLLTVTAGDVLRFRVIRTDGSSTAGYQDNNGTRLVIEEK